MSTGSELNWQQISQSSTDNMLQGYQKQLYISVSDSMKIVSGQCNFPAQREQVQDKNISTIYIGDKANSSKICICRLITVSDQGADWLTSDWSCPKPRTWNHTPVLTSSFMVSKHFSIAGNSMADQYIINVQDFISMKSLLGVRWQVSIL